jgi:hypothetical protein
MLLPPVGCWQKVLMRLAVRGLWIALTIGSVRLRDCIGNQCRCLCVPGDPPPIRAWGRAVSYRRRWPVLFVCCHSSGDHFLLGDRDSRVCMPSCRNAGVLALADVKPRRHTAIGRSRPDRRCRSRLEFGLPLFAGRGRLLNFSPMTRGAPPSPAVCARRPRPRSSRKWRLGP